MSPEKVKDLAAQIVRMIDENPRLHLNERAEAVQVAVGSAILDDLREEDEIDAEVDDLLKQHEADIDRESMDHEMLRKKFREQIARKRGFTL